MEIIEEGRSSDNIIYLLWPGPNPVRPGLRGTCKYWSFPFPYAPFPPQAPAHSVLKDEQRVCRILYARNLWLWMLLSFSGEDSYLLFAK